MQDTFPFKAMKEIHEQHKTKLEIDELITGTTTTSAVTTGSGVPGSLLAGLLESCRIFA
jgi:hypothetical protein